MGVPELRLRVRWHLLRSLRDGARPFLIIDEGAAGSACLLLPSANDRGAATISRMGDKGVDARIIETELGRIRVLESDRGVVTAHAIPYAHAERFAVPVPVATLAGERRTDADGVFDATRRGTVFPQRPGHPDDAAGEFVVGMEQDEDCLTVTVTTPGLRSEAGGLAAGLPVMVWIHGGGYTNGSGEGQEYDAEDLVRKGIVVVAVTYRLGVCGYLNPDADGPQNLGLRDQLEALRWVHAHIADFGGDPERVTVAGQSAGGDAVLALLATPDARPLFQRAIVQSAPTGLKTKQYHAMREALRGVVRERIGVGRDAAGAPIDEVLDAQQAAVEESGKYGFSSGMPFAPQPGAEPLPQDVAAELREAARTHELLIGWTAEEARAFIPTMPIGETALRFGAPGRGVAGAVAAAMTRVIFSRPARRVAGVWRAAGGTATTYMFDWEPGGTIYRACHAIELPFIFSGDWTGAPMMAGRGPDPALADRMRTAWARFVARGTAGLPAPGRGYLRFGRGATR